MCSSLQPAEPAIRRGRGNPTLHLVPRCGARTRSGGACRAPAVHGKPRCRMHGGRSTGARTAEGRARLAALHTRHGFFTPKAHLERCCNRAALQRARIVLQAFRLMDALPPEMVERLRQGPPELLPPGWTLYGPSVPVGLADLEAGAALLAPWREAIDAIRLSRRGARPEVRHPTEPAPKELVTASPHAPIPPPPRPPLKIGDGNTPCTNSVHPPAPPRLQPPHPAALRHQQRHARRGRRPGRLGPRRAPGAKRYRGAAPRQPAA